jgi:hypothetical protein
LFPWALPLLQDFYTQAFKEATVRAVVTASSCSEILSNCTKLNSFTASFRIVQDSDLEAKMIVMKCNCIVKGW